MKGPGRGQIFNPHYVRRTVIWRMTFSDLACQGRLFGDQAHLRLKRTGPKFFGNPCNRGMFSESRLLHAHIRVCGGLYVCADGRLLI